MKVCTKCGMSKRIGSFGKDSKNEDSKHKWCKKCVCKSQRIWRKLKKQGLSVKTTKHYDAWWTKEDKDLMPVNGTVAKPIKVKVGTAVMKEGIVNLILDSLPSNGRISLEERG